MFWPSETSTSTCLSLATIYSGLYRFLGKSVLLDAKRHNSSRTTSTRAIKPSVFSDIDAARFHHRLLTALMPTFTVRWRWRWWWWWWWWWSGAAAKAGSNVVIDGIGG
jgi:hypothetical protein